MRGFSKFIWILFICSISYNIFIGIHLFGIKNDIAQLYLALEGTGPVALKELSHSEIIGQIAGKHTLENKWETYLFLFFEINGLLSLVLVYRNWHFWKDKIKVRNKVPFQKLPKENQIEILNKVFCSVCLAQKEAVFKHEKILLGIPYIIVNCKECNNEIKIKDSW